MEYTEKIHAERLLKMLENRKNPCACCPANPYYNPEFERGGLWENDPCLVCAAFLGMKFDWRNPCPCLNLGRPESIKRTWLAIEEKGYI